MSGGGGEGIVENSRSMESEMIALNLFGLDQQMDQYGAIGVGSEQDLNKGNGFPPRISASRKDTGNNSNAEKFHQTSTAGGNHTAAAAGEYQRLGWLRDKRVENIGDAKAGGRAEKPRRRRHSEKSVRGPRAKAALVRQISEDSNGFINLFFDSESEVGLLLTDNVQTIPESDSRPSFFDSATEGVQLDRVKDLDTEADRQQGGGSDDAKHHGKVQSSSIPIIKKLDPDDCDSAIIADAKEIDDKAQDMTLDISLSVADTREYSPSPGGDTQPLLLDEGHSESSLRFIGEIVLPFLLAGFGCVFAGIVLDLVKKRAVFVEVSEFFILVPALLGLKGNLEMTLASRLSTHANLGHMDTTADQWKLIGGNLALTQVQAIIVGLLAAIFAMMLGWIPEQKFNVMQGFLLCTGSVLTAAIASFVLGSIMIGVVMLSRKLHINPDNIATPIAASLGDLITISLLAEIATLLFQTIETQIWLTPLFLFSLIAFIPLWWYISHMNRYTHGVLYTGWMPVIGAMVISSLGGLVLDHTVKVYEGVAPFQPVINGVGGNLAAVQASRLSTALHKVSTPGHLPENAVHGCPNPITTFFGKSTSARTARLLMLLVIPGQFIFMFTIHLLRQTEGTQITPAFACIYLTAAVLQVTILLYIANGLVHFLWKRGNDPDNSSIPCLTAIGDLLGTLFLALAFLILSKTNPQESKYDEVNNTTETTRAFQI